MRPLIERGVSAALGLLVAVSAAAQETSSEVAIELDKLLRAATGGRTVIRPQAAKRIVRLFERSGEDDRRAIVERILADAGESAPELARLGSAVVEILGELDDARLRALLWAGIDDPDFPWRPYAARSVAVAPHETEAERFEVLLEDPIAPVRAAAIEAFGELARTDARALLRARLADEDDRVRRAAADRLACRGQYGGLWWLLEELSREDSFFDRPTGEQGRFAAMRVLERHLGQGFGFDPAAAPGEGANATALARIEAAVRELSPERPELPELASASGPTPGEVLGLELRSCRRGEFFLRWTADDRLLVGQGNPAAIGLEPGTVAELARVAERSTATTTKRFFGSPGCDLEQLLLRPAGSQGTLIWIVSKGPEAVEGLRPPEFRPLFDRLLETLPDGPSDDSRLEHLRTRTRAALESIGGP